MSENNPKMPAATISIIVPAYNESLFIEDCLSAITRECHRANIDAELIVIDNGSTDNTAQLARQHTPHVKTITRTSVSNARNTGAGMASNSLLAFIDADVVITQRWAQTLLLHYERYLQQPLFIAGHQYIVRQQGSWIEKHWFGNIQDKLLNGGNIITSGQAFELIAGFDGTLKTGEDYDFCNRAIDAQCEYLDDEGYEAIHLGFPRTLTHFVKREYWHGEGDFKSLALFVRSPVAIIAVLYSLVQLCILVLIIQGVTAVAILLLTSLLIGNLILTRIRFKTAGIMTVMLNSVLNYCYFCARSASMFRMLSNRNRQY